MVKLQEWMKWLLKWKSAVENMFWKICQVAWESGNVQSWTKIMQLEADPVPWMNCSARQSRLVRLHWSTHLNVWLDQSLVAGLQLTTLPDEWRKTNNMSINKNKGEMNDCKIYRDKRLLSTVVKVYSRIVIERERERSEEMVSDQ